MIKSDIDAITHLDIEEVNLFKKSNQQRLASSCRFYDASWMEELRNFLKLFLLNFKYNSLQSEEQLYIITTGDWTTKISYLNNEN